MKVFGVLGLFLPCWQFNLESQAQLSKQHCASELYPRARLTEGVNVSYEDKPYHTMVYEDNGIESLPQ